MLVSDLNHFLDLPGDTPGPARRLAGTAWESVLPCQRRPGNRRCPGRMIVLRTEAGAPIRWQCSVCDDEGVISNWEDSPFDLRRRQLTIAQAANEIVIPSQVAAALRDRAAAGHRLRTTRVPDPRLGRPRPSWPPRTTTWTS